MNHTRVAFAPFMAVLVSLVALFVPIWVLSRSGDAGLGPVNFLLSGKVFSDRPLVIGGALDQPSLHKEIFILCYSLVVICPCIALIRWLNRHGGRGLRRLFAVCSLFLLAHPFSIFTIFTDDVFRYILRMGFTPMRLAGLALALVTYAILLLFAIWTCGHSRRDAKSSRFSMTHTKAGGSQTTGGN